MSQLADISELVRRLGWFTKFDITPAGGTGNNRVFVLRSDGERYLLKRYFHHPADPRDRFGTERAFYDFTREASITWVPKSIAWDAGEKLAIFEFIEGERPAQATLDLVQQALAFFSAINASRSLPSAAALPIASEACFSIREHLQTVERRIQRLDSIASKTEIDREAADFVTHALAPAWRDVAHSIRSRMSSEELDRNLTPEQRCISPSDFGFHNSILGTDGRLRFFDFEYAGWDDPAKTICDFFCQPAVPVPYSQREGFTAQVTALFLPDVPQRFSVLFPAYQLKWCCIMLNDFLPTESLRRSFSNPEAPHNQRKQRQLEAVFKFYKHAFPSEAGSQ
jgi:hypothetical protein